MAIFNIKDSKIKPVVFATTGLFLFLAVAFFLPIDIPHKLAFPVGLLFISSLWLTKWEISLALLFSALGDYAGSCYEHFWQILFFGAGHICYTLFFVRRYFAKVDRGSGPMSRRAVAHVSIFTLCVIAVLAVALALVVPNMPAGLLRIAGGVYAVIICGMFLMALLQRSSLYALGAALFVISDLVLAWNRYVEPIESASLYVLGTYFLAQWLIYVRSTPYEVPHPVRLLRF